MPAQTPSDQAVAVGFWIFPPDRELGLLLALLAVLVAGCASTTVRFEPAPPDTAVCQAAGESVSALVLWAPAWRPDQKDVPLREVAAEQGVRRFFDDSGCFARVRIQRAASGMPADAQDVRRLAAISQLKPDRIVAIWVRELGPVVKLLASPALVDGGTEVVLTVGSYSADGSARTSLFSVHWQNGGPGVVKGVATLPADMAAALDVALRPGVRAR